jgi:hypothetical protein
MVKLCGQHLSFARISCIQELVSDPGMVHTASRVQPWPKHVTDSFSVYSPISKATLATQSLNPWPLSAVNKLQSPVDKGAILAQQRRKVRNGPQSHQVQQVLFLQTYRLSF